MAVDKKNIFLSHTAAPSPYSSDSHSVKKTIRNGIRLLTPPIFNESSPQPMLLITLHRIKSQRFDIRTAFTSRYPVLPDTI